MLETGCNISGVQVFPTLSCSFCFWWWVMLGNKCMQDYWSFLKISKCVPFDLVHYLISSLMPLQLKWRWTNTRMYWSQERLELCFSLFLSLIPFETAPSWTQIEPKIYSLSGKKKPNKQCLVLQKFIQLRNYSDFLHFFPSELCQRYNHDRSYFHLTSLYLWRDHALVCVVGSNSCSTDTAKALQLLYISVDYAVVVKILYLGSLYLSFLLTELWYTISKGINKILNELCIWVYKDHSD